MRSIYLVARRDYLGYVQAWGFWLGLLLTPLLMAVGIMAPSWAASSQPTRYYTVIESGTAFSDALRAQLDEERILVARMTIDPIGVMNGNPNGSVTTFDAAIDEGLSVDEALERAGGAAASVPQADFIAVDPPAGDEASIRPFLLGEQMVATDAGPQPLFAAIFVPDGDGEIEYWSENVTSDSLLNRVRATERALTERRVFEAAGVSPRILAEAEEQSRPVAERRARPASSDTGSAVTMADRAPFYAAVFMAFLLWFLIFSVVNYLLMGTIEERSNKIFDALLTSVKLAHAGGKTYRCAGRGADPHGCLGHWREHNGGKLREHDGPGNTRQSVRRCRRGAETRPAGAGDPQFRAWLSDVWGGVPRARLSL